MGYDLMPLGCLRARATLGVHAIASPKIERHGRFRVVRDDLIPGGSKTRALLDVLGEGGFDRVAYACDRFGYGPIALAHASRILGIEALLIFPAMPEPTESFIAVSEFDNVKVIVRADAANQSEAFERALEIAAHERAHLFPAGFDTPEFAASLAKTARQLDIDPAEVWTLAGSGCLSRALQSVWTTAEVHAVSMGFPHAKTGRAIVHHTTELPHEPAVIPPPYPSARHYDAKVWQFASELGQDDALIWNVA